MRGEWGVVRCGAVRESRSAPSRTTPHSPRLYIRPHAIRHFLGHFRGSAYGGEKRLRPRSGARGGDLAVRVRRGDAAPDDALRGVVCALGHLLYPFPRGPLPRRDRADPHARAPGAGGADAAVRPARGEEAVGAGDAARRGAGALSHRDPGSEAGNGVAGAGSGERGAAKLRDSCVRHGARGRLRRLCDTGARAAGRFDPEKARAAGIPEGPLWGKLHKGEPIELADGRKLTADGFVGPRRPGRLVVFTGDTRPCAAVVDAAKGADLLIHEATFGKEEKDRAKETGHSTAHEAAQVALAANAKRLVLSHVSARYSVSAEELVKEAREVFRETVVAKDGMEIDVPFAD